MSSMNKLLPFAFVAAGCAHAQPEPADVRPLDDTEKAHIESRLAVPPSLKPGIDAEITDVAREVAQCVFRYGQTRGNAGDYRARLLVNQPDEANTIVDASVKSDGHVSLGLDKTVYEDQSRTQIVDRGIDGEADSYKFDSSCFLCPGPKHIKFETAEQIRDDWEAQNTYEKMLREIAARCKKGVISGSNYGPPYLH